MKASRSSRCVAGVLAAVTLAAGTGVAQAAPPAPGAAPADGVYEIRRGEALLSLQSGAAEPVLLPPTEDADQTWALTCAEGAMCTIQSPATKVYVSVAGKPQMNSPVVTTKSARPWKALAGGGPDVFSFVLTDADGERLAMAPSMLRIYPPRVALRPFAAKDADLRWRLTKVE